MNSYISPISVLRSYFALSEMYCKSTLDLESLNNPPISPRPSICKPQSQDSLIIASAYYLHNPNMGQSLDRAKISIVSFIQHEGKQTQQTVATNKRAKSQHIDKDFAWTQSFSIYSLQI
jgi:hypothetical protein